MTRQTEATAEGSVMLGRRISFEEWGNAVEIWQAKDPLARRVVACIICWTPIPDFRSPDSTAAACGFDVCEMCRTFREMSLSSEQQSASENAVGQMTLDFTF